MEKWKVKYTSHFSTPPTATGKSTNPLRYTNYLLGTFLRSGQSPSPTRDDASEIVPRSIERSSSRPIYSPFVPVLECLRDLISARVPPGLSYNQRSSSIVSFPHWRFLIGP
jgi:hypothetical protein